MEENDKPEIAAIWDEARAHIERGNFDKAIEIYRYILIRYEDHPVAVEYANTYLGDAYLTLRKLSLAESYIKKAILCNPKKPDYHYLLEFVYSIHRYWNKAVKEFVLAVKVNSTNAEYLRGLGWALFNGGDKLKGLEQLRRANELEPSSVNVLLDLANAYLTMLDFEKAKMYADRALGIEPGNGLAREVSEKITEFNKMYLRARNSRRTT
jgi:tetratricopeptide (TPR) repeat protein